MLVVSCRNIIYSAISSVKDLERSWIGSTLQVSDVDRVSDREDEANPREAEQAGDNISSA